MATELDILNLHRKLDQLAAQYCLVINQLELQYRWSIMQAGSATDIVSRIWHKKRDGS